MNWPANIKLDSVLGPMGLPKLDEAKLKQASLKEELILRRSDLFARAVIRSLRTIMLMAAVIGFVENYKTALKIYLAIIGFLAILLFGLGCWASPKRLTSINLDTGPKSQGTDQQKDSEINE